MAPAEPSAERGEAFRPQYVSVHSLREHGHGPRNLAWGVVTLVFAVALISTALFIVGPKALLSLAVCLLTFTALFVLARMHVFRQRNGGFLALGIVCLFGAGMPLLELAFGALDHFIKNRPFILSAAPAPGLAGNPAAPLSLIEAFALPVPDPKAGSRVRALKDTSVTVEGKSYLVKTGDLFALAGRSGREVTVAARDLLVALPADAVEVLEDKPAPARPAVAAVAAVPAVAEAAPKRPAGDAVPAAALETTEEITANSVRETVRRYPALGIKGSLENQMFLNMYNELRENGGDEFFKNAEWPVELAELLAKRHRWQRGAAPATVGPVDAPEPEAIPAEPVVPR